MKNITGVRMILGLMNAYNRYMNVWEWGLYIIRIKECIEPENKYRYKKNVGLKNLILMLEI